MPRVPFFSFSDLLTALLGIVGALLEVPTAAIVQVLVQELVLSDEAAELGVIDGRASHTRGEDS